MEIHRVSKELGEECRNFTIQCTSIKTWKYIHHYFIFNYTLIFQFPPHFRNKQSITQSTTHTQLTNPQNITRKKTITRFKRQAQTANKQTKLITINQSFTRQKSHRQRSETDRWHHHFPSRPFLVGVVNEAAIKFD